MGYEEDGLSEDELLGVSVSITYDSIWDPRAFSERMGIVPTSQWAIGDEHRGTIRKRAFWEVEIPPRREVALNDVLSELLKPIQDRLAVWIEASQNVRAYPQILIHYQVSGTDHGGFTISKKSQELMAPLEANFEITVEVDSSVLADSSVE